MLPLVGSSETLATQTENTVEKISQINFSGQIPEDLEETLNRRAVELEESDPSFVKIAREVYRAVYGSGRKEYKVFPIKLVIREGFENNREPGVAIDGLIFAMRDCSEDIQTVVMNTVENDTFYCEI